jgi:hypothetical protein
MALHDAVDFVLYMFHYGALARLGRRAARAVRGCLNM